MLRSGAVLVFGMILGRLLGFFREVLLVKQFGTSLEADILIALITLPDILVALLVGNALPVVFLKRIQTMSPSQKLRFLLKISFYFLFVFGLLSLALCAFPIGLARFIFPAGYQNPDFIYGLRWVIWTIPILCLNSVTRFFLQAESKFFLVGFENVLFNSCIITGIYLISGSFDVATIAIALIAGSFLRWISQLVQLFLQLRKHPRENPFDAKAFHVSMIDTRTYVIALMTGFSVQIMPIASRSISSAFEGVGSLSTFNYAYKLVELPIGLALTVLSTVLFPKLTQSVLKGDSLLHRVAGQINHALTFVLPLSLVAAFFLLALAQDPQLFSTEKLTDFSTVFTLAAIGLLTFVLRCYNEIYVMILNAKSEVNKPFKSALIAAVVGLGSSVIFTHVWGLKGTFWAINLYYLSLVLANRYFVRQSLVSLSNITAGISWLPILIFSILPIGWYLLFIAMASFKMALLVGFVVLAVGPAFFILKHLYGIGKFINENI